MVYLRQRDDYGHYSFGETDFSNKSSLLKLLKTVKVNRVTAAAVVTGIEIVLVGVVLMAHWGHIVKIGWSRQLCRVCLFKMLYPDYSSSG